MSKWLTLETLVTIWFARRRLGDEVLAEGKVFPMPSQNGEGGREERARRRNKERGGEPASSAALFPSSPYLLAPVPLLPQLCPLVPEQLLAQVLPQLSCCGGGLEGGGDGALFE